MATVITPKENEKIYFTIRKNPVKMGKSFLKFLVFFILSLSALILISNETVALISVVVLIFSLTYAFYNFLIWFYDVYIITSQRVIVVNQRGLFSKEYAEIELGKIHDVTYRINGVFATLLKYGTVIIKGEHTTLELADLSEPDEAQEMIKKLAENIRGTQGGKEMSAQELIDFIEKSRKK